MSSTSEDTVTGLKFLGEKKSRRKKREHYVIIYLTLRMTLQMRGGKP